MPAITASLLWSIPTPQFAEQQFLLNWATLFIALVLVYYLWLSISSIFSLCTGRPFSSSGRAIIMRVSRSITSPVEG